MIKKLSRIKEDVVLWSVSVIAIALGLVLFNANRKTVYDTALEKTVMINVKTAVLEWTISVGTVTPTDLVPKEALVRVAGTGAFITPNGHILTCAHLFTVGKNKSIEVAEVSGSTYSARIVKVDVARDLAIIKIKQKHVPYFTIAKSARIGDTVFAVGNPLLFSFSVSQGIISAVHRLNFLTDMTQTDAALNPGNSGGPLVNLKGQLVGINAGIVPPVDAPIFTGIGLAVSTETIRDFLAQFDGLSNL